jgi:hypothetical protein
MSMTRATLRRGIVGLGMWLLALGLVGCFNPFDPRVQHAPGLAAPQPVPDSPSNVLRLLEWCYEYRAIAEYRELFDADYRFVFSVLDKYGNEYRDRFWNREDELESTSHLFQGGDANQPAAASIRIDLERNFVVTNDPRFPGQGRWRKQIRTSVTLIILDVNQTQTQATGYALFSLARGDVAQIPEELRERGFGPDSTRWYIERHEDLTQAPSTGAARAIDGRQQDLAQATFFSRRSWGYVKAFYR